MRIVVKRRPSVEDISRPGRKTTYSTVFVDEEMECFALEDEIREPADRPEGGFAELDAWVKSWKVFGQTALASGEYELGLRDSPKFGPDTLWIKDTPGFTFALIHGGTDIDSTEGCLIVGNRVDEGRFEIAGAKAAAVLAKLKSKVIRALARGERVTIELRNPSEIAA